MESIRSLIRAPGLTALAALIIGIGLGGSALLYSLVDALVLNPFPVRDPSTLVAIETRTQNELRNFVEDVSLPDFRDLESLQEIFSGIVASMRMPVTIRFLAWGPTPTPGGLKAARAGAPAERVRADFVSQNYFDLLGVPLPLGRAFTESEGLVVVISQARFLRSFDGNPAALGKTIEVNGKLLTVIGVAPRGFRGTLLEETPDLWIPLVSLNEVPTGRAEYDRDDRFFHVLGRLNRDVSFDAARAAVDAQTERLQKEYPETNAGAAFVLLPARDAWLPRTARSSVLSFLGILVIVMAFVLTITCSNVANLLLVRALHRSREIAIRSALGASRGRIARQILVENLTLYAIGLAVGLGFAHLVLKSLSFSAFVLLDRDVAFAPTLDGRVVLSMAALALVSGLLFGLIPAMKGSKASLRTGPVSGGNHLARGLIVPQTALATTLLIGAALFVRTLVNLMNVDPGFRDGGVLLASVDFSSLEQKYDAARGTAFYRDALERIRALPGVRAAAWGSTVPLESRRLFIRFYPEDRRPEKDSDWITSECNIVGPDYFQILGVPILGGREFGTDDREDSTQVAVINEAMARKYWPGGDEVGRRFWVQSRTGVKSVEIVGVAHDVKQSALRSDAQPYMYLAASQRFFFWGTLHVKTAGDPYRAWPAVRAVFSGIDADVPVHQVTTLTDHVASTFARERVGAQVLAASALFALAIAALGVYGVTAFSAARRTNEVGVRMALGARAFEIQTLFVRDGVLPVLIGVALGCVAAGLLSRFVGSVLYGVPALDSLTFAASALALVAVATLASYVPARRAAAVDPKVTLQHD